MTNIEIVKGDITTLPVDAIVNAANNSLLGGGGVDGAIHRAAGPDLLRECRQLSGCATGEAKITRGYNLPARYVIHTVGPVYGHEGGREPELLASCYLKSFELACCFKLKSIAFPSISTGAYGYPIGEAATVALTTTRDFVANNAGALERVIFVTFSDADFHAYLDTRARLSL
jgi:O-acetyl-ADP-ribose deacetylase (regulator of RNase III)